MNKFSSSVTYEKPRRLEEDTIQYLLQFDEQFTEQLQQVSSYNITSSLSSLSADDPPSDSPLDIIAIMINNVLDEIKYRLASTICEKSTNYLLERICSYANISQLVDIMNKCQTYIIFLSQNRYGSHVIQAILSRLCFLFKNNQIDQIDDKTLESTILSFIQPLLNSFKYLATEISGSHVLRSVLCLLSGLPCISEKKGKGSKHQHAVSLSEPLDSLLIPSEPGKTSSALRVIDSRKCFPVPSSFHAALLAAAESLLSPSTPDAKVKNSVRASRELQELVANTTSCAALTVLLRILLSPHVIPGGEELAIRVIKCVFEYDAPIDNVDGDLCAVVFYAMGGDKSGSYFMETVIDCTSISFVSSLLSRGLTLESDPFTLVDQFARDNVGNYVLQSILKRLHREMMCILTFQSNKLMFSVESPEERELNHHTALMMATKFLSTSSLCHSTLYLPYLCEDSNRGGIVLWLIQLASQIHEILSNESPIAKTHSALLPLWTHPFTSSDGATHATSRADELALSLLSVWAEQTPKYAPWSDSDLSYWNSNDFTSKLDACLIRKLANIPHAGAKGASKDNAPTGDDNQQSIVNLTARLIAAILGMNSSLSCRVISKALTRLPSDILLPICFSGPISRCIMDPFFLCKSNSRDRSALLTSFILPNLVPLSTHPIGHHVVRRCYESLTSVDKERLLDAMNSSSSFTGPSSQSREIKSLISTVHLDVYRTGISEWRALISKQKKAEIMLAELEKATESSKSIDNTQQKSKKRASHDDIDDIFPPEEEISTKRKEKSQPNSSSGNKNSPHSSSPKVETVDPDTLNDDKKRKRKRKRPSTSSSTSAPSSSNMDHHEMSPQPQTPRGSTPTRNKPQSVDMNRIKNLQSGKMINIKKITQELENDLNRKKRRE